MSDILQRPKRVERMAAINTRLHELRGFDRMSGTQEREAERLMAEFDQLSAANRAEEVEELQNEDVRQRIRAGVADGSMRVERDGDGGLDPSWNGSTPNGNGLYPMRTYPLGGSGGDTRDQARRVIDSANRSNELPDHAAVLAENLVCDGPAFEQTLAARWVTTTGAPAYRTAFAKLAADPERGHLLWTPEEADAFRTVAAYQGEMRAMSLTTTAGGFMVPLTLDPAILLTSAGSINPLRKISRVVQTMTNSWHGVTSAGASAEWKTENAQAADASPTIGEVVIPVYLGDAYVPYSYEVGMDAENFLGELTKVLVDSADQLMATAYTTGTGSAQPTGIITAIAAVGGSLVTPGTAETFVKGDVYKVQNALPPRFQGNAQWAGNLAILNTLRQFETTNGALAFPEIESDRLLRHPLNEVSNMDPSFDITATASNYLLIYGDFQEFVIVDRTGGTTVEFIPNTFGANGRPNAQRGAFLWFRTGSDAAVTNAFRMLSITTAA
jgi:HK97 family phage major capsid protein